MFTEAPATTTARLLPWDGHTAVGGVVLVAAVLAAVHVFAGRIRSLGSIPRNRWLSVSAGVSVAYVFVHLLPDLAERHAAVAPPPQSAGGVAGAAQERWLFLVVLLGFVTYYGVESAVRRSRAAPGRGEIAGGSETSTSTGVFWTHVGLFAAVDGIVGYLLVQRESSDPLSLALFGVAMALHFLVNDVGLREAHHEAYHDVGRWLLSAAVVVGVVVGYLLPVRGVVVDGLLAFLSGAVVLDVVKEELPPERQSRFWAFATGALGYSLVLLPV